jgi:ketosteroid isomerase-like protein
MTPSSGTSRTSPKFSPTVHLHSREALVIRRPFPTLFLALSLVLMSASMRIATAQAGAATPSSAVAELIATDQRFSAAARTTDVISGLTAMMADDVIVPLPPGRWVEGVAEVRAALAEAAENRTARAEWVPVRAGVSADGLHGFTYGYMTIHRPDSTSAPLKYLSYWVKGASGWRVAVYRRGRRPDGPVSLAMMPPAVPERIAVAATDSPDALAASLRAAEKAFSDEAQAIGLGKAFAKHGSADAMNMGGPNDTAFVIGAARIGAGIDGPEPTSGSPVNWGADRVIVAASGDLGVTLGRIRRNDDTADAGRPFFTIWRRAPGQPWRYIAE